MRFIATALRFHLTAVAVLFVLAPAQTLAATPEGNSYDVVKRDLTTLQDSGDQYTFTADGEFVSGEGIGIWQALGTDGWLSFVPGPDFALTWGTVLGAGNEFILGYGITAQGAFFLFGQKVDNPDCQLDSDGDRLADCVETNTGVFNGPLDSGTNPLVADTDGDSIDDGDEVLGTLAGLDLPAMGLSPLRKEILVEYDWFDDSNECASHTHEPNQAVLERVAGAFANSPVANPDGSTGITFIQDVGQGGPFTGGNLINDADGVLTGGVSSSEFKNYKAANYAANREGYFHYTLFPHRYNTTSGSSGQAEINGDDMIVSLACNNSDTRVANTIMHEIGHNLGLRHGGFENCNYKANYNSVMNYKYQFPGVDTNCTPPGDGRLDYSLGDRIDLNEFDLDETEGTCGVGNPWDWNGNTSIETSVQFDVNPSGSSTCLGAYTTLRDHDDWATLLYGGVVDSDGERVVQEIIDCQAPPQ